MPRISSSEAGTATMASMTGGSGVEGGAGGEDALTTGGRTTAVA